MIAARLPAIFGIAGFPALWVSLSLAGLAASISQIALSWTSLELTASPLGVALTMTVRMAPSLLLGIPLGAASDRVDRRSLIRAVNLAAAATGLIVAGLAFGGYLGVPAILFFSFVFGTIDTARTSATQAYVYDLVGKDRATNGLAMSNLGVQLFGSAGAILGGILIAAGGLGSGFGVATACWLVAAIVLGADPHDREPRRRPPHAERADRPDAARTEPRSPLDPGHGHRDRGARILEHDPHADLRP